MITNSNFIAQNDFTFEDITLKFKGSGAGSDYRIQTTRSSDKTKDGNIILGMIGNEVLLKESNDRIAFLQNNVEVAYFSNNKLFVTSAEFTNGIKIFELEVSKEANGSFTIG